MSAKELNIGDYVRTKDGIIDQYKGSENAEIENFIITEIIKSSPNIIDLIEVGDYVNGAKVVKIEEYNKELYVYVQETEYCNACDEEENIYYKEDTIKSIITKEQFESMEYNIESE